MVKQVTLGVDIGGTRIKAVALDTPDVILESYEGPSDAKKSAEAVRVSVGLAVRHFTEKGFKPLAIGVGCAGSIEPVTGVVRNSPNFSEFNNIPLRAWVEEDFRVPTTVDNDANCAVFGEWKMGNAQNVRNVVLLTLGTGVGGGLILNGQLFRGSTGTGGELGHFSIHANGRECPCGNRGCFERYCSASALREMSGGPYSAREIFTRASEPFFKSLIDRFMSDFKVGLTSLANMFDPDIILFSGGVAKGVASYFPELQKWLQKHAFPAVGAHVKLQEAKHGNLSGSLGAALLARERLSE